MSGHYSQQSMVVIEHQRMVLKPVRMIVHVSSVEEECAVLRLCHEVVPFVGGISSIASYFEHPTYFKKS